MSSLEQHHTVHTVAVAAPADVVYGLVAKVTDWPQHFAPNVHVEQLAFDEHQERIQIWAIAHGVPRTWISRREFDPQARSVRFRQEVSSPPVASMGGEWVVKEEAPGQCVLTLHHDFTAVDDNPEGVALIESATDRNSNAELAAVKELAEKHERLGELVFTFEDTVEVNGPVAKVYAFLNEAPAWPERLPHVARIDLTEDTPGLQVMEMDTKAADGSLHTTRSVRVCFPEHLIVYKQTKVPPIMGAHTGRWILEERGGVTFATSQHTVTVRPEAVEEVLGAGRTVAEARGLIQKALSTNSSTTLRHAKAFAEASAGRSPAGSGGGAAVEAG